MNCPWGWLSLHITSFAPEAYKTIAHLPMLTIWREELRNRSHSRLITSGSPPSSNKWKHNWLSGQLVFPTLSGIFPRLYNCLDFTRSTEYTALLLHRESPSAAWQTMWNGSETTRTDCDRWLNIWWSLHIFTPTNIYNLLFKKCNVDRIYITLLNNFFGP